MTGKRVFSGIQAFASLGLSVLLGLFVCILPFPITSTANAADAKGTYLAAKTCDAKSGFSAMGFESGAEIAASRCHDFKVIPDQGGWVRLQLSGTDLVLRTKACHDQVGYDVVGLAPRSAEADAACELWRLVPQPTAQAYGLIQSKQTLQFLHVAVYSHGTPVARLNAWAEGNDYATACRFWRPQQARGGLVRLELQVPRGRCQSGNAAAQNPGQARNTLGEFWKMDYTEAAPLEQAKRDAGGEGFKYQGKIYGWYDVGWKGPGFYVVDSGNSIMAVARVGTAGFTMELIPSSMGSHARVLRQAQ